MCAGGPIPGERFSVSAALYLEAWPLQLTVTHYHAKVFSVVVWSIEILDLLCFYGSGREHYMSQIATGLECSNFCVLACDVLVVYHSEAYCNRADLLTIQTLDIF